MNLATEFRKIPGFPSHTINRAGEIVRVAEPASNNGARNQFRPGYVIQGCHLPAGSFRNRMVLLTQGGRKLQTTVRELVKRTFGETWDSETLRGEDSHLAKLTDEKVIVIRERYASGETLSALARDFHVGVPNIHAIVNGRSWKHLLPGFEGKPGTLLPDEQEALFDCEVEEIHQISPAFGGRKREAQKTTEEQKLSA